MNSLEKALKQYYRQVRSWLPCSRKLKKHILEQIDHSISAYLHEHPAAKITDIKTRFGEPEEIAAAHVDELGTAELLRDLRVRKKIVTIIAACAAVLILMWASAVTYALIDRHAAVNGYYEIGDITSLNTNGDLK